MQASNLVSDFSYAECQLPSEPSGTLSIPSMSSDMLSTIMDLDEGFLGDISNNTTLFPVTNQHSEPQTPVRERRVVAETTPEKRQEAQLQYLDTLVFKLDFCDEEQHSTPGEYGYDNLSITDSESGHLSITESESAPDDTFLLCDEDLTTSEYAENPVFIDILRRCCEIYMEYTQDYFLELGLLHIVYSHPEYLNEWEETPCHLCYIEEDEGLFGRRLYAAVKGSMLLFANVRAITRIKEWGFVRHAVSNQSSMYIQDLFHIIEQPFKCSTERISIDSFVVITEK